MLINSKIPFPADNRSTVAVDDVDNGGFLLEDIAVRCVSTSAVLSTFIVVDSVVIGNCCSTFVDDHCANGDRVGTEATLDDMSIDGSIGAVESVAVNGFLPIRIRSIDIGIGAFVNCTASRLKLSAEYANRRPSDERI